MLCSNTIPILKKKKEEGKGAQGEEKHINEGYLKNNNNNSDSIRLRRLGLGTHSTGILLGGAGKDFI